MLRWLSGRLPALALSTFLISAISAGTAKAEDCSNEKSLKGTSKNSVFLEPVRVCFLTA